MGLVRSDSPLKRAFLVMYGSWRREGRAVRHFLPTLTFLSLDFELALVILSDFLAKTTAKPAKPGQTMARN